MLYVQTHKLQVKRLLLCSDDGDDVWLFQGWKIGSQNLGF